MLKPGANRACAYAYAVIDRFYGFFYSHSYFYVTLLQIRAIEGPNCQVKEVLEDRKQFVYPGVIDFCRDFLDIIM